MSNGRAAPAIFERSCCRAWQSTPLPLEKMPMIQVELNGKLTEVSKHQLLALASRGMIGPGAILVVDGKVSTAGKIKGIVFGGENAAKPVVQNNTKPVGQNQIYGIASPPLTPAQSGPTIEIIIDGKSRTVTKQQLFALASRGSINPQTPIKVNGTHAKAGKIKGITFGQSQTGQPPLVPSVTDHSFTDAEQAEIKHFLAEFGSNITTVDEEGKTLLHKAAGLANVTVAKFLVSKGADVNAKANNGCTPLFDAYKVTVAKFLVSKGANVNERDNIGDTPLHDVVDIEVAQFLISKGANIEAKNNYGETPLQVAMNLIVGKNEKIRFLLSNGANVNARNNDGLTTLHLAVTEKKNIEIVENLVCKGANVNAKATVGELENWTPLHFAVTVKNNFEIIEYLVSHGANVNAQINGMLTPLDVLLGENDVDDDNEIAVFLMSNGARALLTESEMSTPLPIMAIDDVDTLNSYFSNYLYKTIWAVLFLFVGVVFLLIASANSNGHLIWSGGIAIVGAIIHGIQGLVYKMKLLYQLWKLIPADIARTTPGYAVWLNFIPIFAYYWQFVAFWGLGTDLNKTLQRQGIPYQVNSSLGLGLCITHSCIVILPGIGILGTLVGEIVTIFFLKSAKNGAITLLEQGGTNPHINTTLPVSRMNQQNTTGGNTTAFRVGIAGFVILLLVACWIGWSIITGATPIEQVQVFNGNIWNSNGWNTSAIDKQFTVAERIKITKFLVSSGSDGNMTEFRFGIGGDTTILHKAAYCGEIEVVKYLVFKGADVNVKSVLSIVTPLHEAVRGLNTYGTSEKYGEVIKFLVSNGADVNAKDRFGHTLLYDAARHKTSVDVAKFLISNGADVNASTNTLDNETPLHIAAYFGNIEIIKCLVSKGADVNARDTINDTPLHKAARNGEIEVAKFLVSNGANVNAKNIRDETPLNAAKGQNNTETEAVVEYLSNVR